jgi:hypothetical protein
LREYFGGSRFASYKFRLSKILFRYLKSIDIVYDYHRSCLAIAI